LAFDRDGRFAACFERHYPRVLAYGLRRLPDRAAAEDAAAETFLVAWRRFGDHQPAASWASDGGDDAGANAAAARGLTSSCRRSFPAITEYR
jgi:predicted RNA polymerase sigma factor